MGSAILAVITAVATVLQSGVVCGMGAGVSVSHLCQPLSAAHSEQAAVPVSVYVQHTAHCALSHHSACVRLCAVCAVCGPCGVGEARGTRIDIQVKLKVFFRSVSFV